MRRKASPPPPPPPLPPPRSSSRRRRSPERCASSRSSTWWGKVGEERGGLRGWAGGRLAQAGAGGTPQGGTPRGGAARLRSMWVAASAGPVPSRGPHLPIVGAQQQPPGRRHEGLTRHDAQHLLALLRGRQRQQHLVLGHGLRGIRGGGRGGGGGGSGRARRGVAVAAIGRPRVAQPQRRARPSLRLPCASPAGWAARRRGGPWRWRPGSRSRPGAAGRGPRRRAAGARAGWPATRARATW
jgi:hypothetical protein